MAKITKIEAVGPIHRKLRVAAYCRVSTDNDDQHLSLEAQKKHYEQFIKANIDWTYCGVYADAGISGTKKENREALMLLVSDCEKHRIDLIVTKSISRFARNTTDCLELVRRLTGLGIRIIFESEKIDTGSMESELILTILSGLAESESVSISENNKWAITKRFQNGTFRQSQAPYGYDAVDGKLVPNAERSVIVKRIFADTLLGLGSNKIAKSLNVDGIKPLRGSNWTATTIRGILTNEKYIGDTLMQKTYTDRSFKRHYNHGEKEQYYMENSHEAIISRRDFEEAARLLSERGASKGVQKDTDKYLRRYALSGRIICGECGSTFKRRIHKKNQSTTYIAWGCKTHTYDKTKCSMVFQNDETIKSAFTSALRNLAEPKNSELKALISHLMKNTDSKLLLQVAGFDRKLEETAEQADVLQTLASRGHLEPALFNSQNNELI